MTEYERLGAWWFAVAAGAAAWLWLLMPSAHATILQGQFSGTVQSGSDLNNAFGLGFGADLAGQPISGTFKLDSAAFQFQSSSGGTDLNAGGGPLFGGPIMMPPAAVTEIVNGHALTSIGGDASSAFVLQNSHTTTGFGVAVSVDLNNTFGTIVDYAKLDSTTSIISNINDIGTVDFDNIDGGVINSGGFPYGGEIFQGGGADQVILFTVTDMSVTPAITSTAVSEPGTLALLAGWLAAFGLRRRRMAAVVV